MPLLSLLLVACGGASTTVADVDAPTHDGTQLDATSSDATSASDPALPGTATVTTSTAAIPGAMQNRTLSSTVFVPSTPGPRALVIVSPGFQMARTQYTSYATHLASWGFVVILTDYAESGFFVDHPRLAADVPAVITWALAQSALEIDPQRIAAAGHSLGGKVSVFAASLEPRIKAVVAWDPVDSSNPSVVPEKMTSLTAAIAVVGETTNGAGGGMPCAPTAENFEQFYAAAPSPALSVTVVGADHMDWVDDPSCTLCGFCTAGSAPNERARTITRRVDVAWLRRQLFADTTMDIWLDAPPELAAGTAAVARR